jgi:hypothetical protein
MKVLAMIGAAVMLAAPAARADQPLTMQAVRMMAAADAPPTVGQVEDLLACPNLRWITDMKSDELLRLGADARSEGVRASTLWFRRNDAAIERCLTDRLPGRRG